MSKGSLPAVNSSEKHGQTTASAKLIISLDTVLVLHALSPKQGIVRTTKAGGKFEKLVSIRQSSVRNPIKSPIVELAGGGKRFKKICQSACKESHIKQQLACAKGLRVKMHKTMPQQTCTKSKVVAAAS